MMKSVLIAALAAVATAFAPVSTAGRASTALSAEMSKSIPYLTKPKNLDGWVGNRESDPLGLAESFDIKWMREAELKHSRVAMLACLGYVSPELFPWARGVFPGEAYTHTNPINAVFAVPPAAMIQIVIACGFIEWGLNKGKMTQLDMFDDPKRVPGDFGWDPLRLGTPENIETYKNRELENGRLAMIAIGGMIHGSFVTGEGVFGSTF